MAAEVPSLPGYTEGRLQRFFLNDLALSAHMPSL
jgi:hypothetical protein